MPSPPVQVQVRGVAPTPTGGAVFLGAAGKVIAIFVDHGVAMAITLALQGTKASRPLTHDLISSILAGLGARVEKVVINDLKGDTFFARLYLVQENELGRNVVEIDARPSDSMAIALQHKCPILVAREVWNEAEDMTWAMQQVEGDKDAPDPGPA